VRKKSVTSHRLSQWRGLSLDIDDGFFWKVIGSPPSFSVGNWGGWSSLSPSSTWSRPSLVFKNDWSSLLLVLVDLVLDFLHWDDLSDFLDMWDNLLLRLVVNVDDWLVNLHNMEVVLVDVVLMDSVLVKIFLMNGMDMQVMLVQMVSEDDFLLLVVFVDLLLVVIVDLDVLLMGVVVVDLVDVSVLLNDLWWLSPSP